MKRPARHCRAGLDSGGIEPGYSPVFSFSQYFS